jgi:hypothetical protein
MKEHKIGEIFEFHNRIPLRVEKSKGDCEGCYFNNYSMFCKFNECRAKLREDKTTVIFKEVKQ